MKSTKVCEIIVPKNILLNDNINNSPKNNMGKMKILADWTKEASEELETGIEKLNNDGERICLCKLWKPEFEYDTKNVILLINHFKLNQRFDLANYERTMKPVIDVMSGVGYFDDDNHYIIGNMIFSGGDRKDWKKNNIWGLKDEVYNMDLKEYFESKIPKYRLSELFNNRFKKANRCTSLSDYDIFQIYILKNEEED